MAVCEKKRCWSIVQLLWACEHVWQKRPGPERVDHEGQGELEGKWQYKD